MFKFNACFFLLVLKAYLCLDSVYVGCNGDLLFLMPKNTGTSFHDMLFNTEHAHIVDKFKYKFNHKLFTQFTVATPN